eukprot:8195981-Alexandrium_andersonii.AAC.1
MGIQRQALVLGCFLGVQAWGKLFPQRGSGSPRGKPSESRCPRAYASTCLGVRELQFISGVQSSRRVGAGTATEGAERAENTTPEFRGSMSR